jgi:guanine nucleotide-binding protein subunit alpha, other
MRIIHERGFPDEERRQIRAVIYSNMVIAFRLLLEIMSTEGFGFADEKTKIHAETVEAMWLDSGVQLAVAKGHEFALHDNLSLYETGIEASLILADVSQLLSKSGSDVCSKLDAR